MAERHKHCLGDMKVTKINIHSIITAVVGVACRTRFVAWVPLLAFSGVVAAQEVGTIIQAIGTVHVDGKPVRTGAVVAQGQKISTGKDGYLYVQTRDKGYFILRPNSTATIPTYHIDAAQPANSRFKIELEQGVARSISGEAVPAARHNFRFNTPVAAIGVLGTDFTVYTDQETTRVAVAQGGIVVSNLGGACQAADYGPCQTEQRQQLLASQAGHILQVQRGAQAPQLLRNPALSPDVEAPPQKDEPSKSSDDSGTITGSRSPLDAVDPLDPLKATLLEPSKLVRPVPLPPAQSAIQWGRWAGLAGMDSTMNLTAARANAELFGLGRNFAVLRDKSFAWTTPIKSSVDLRLNGYDAQVSGPTGTSSAVLENGQLNINFGNSRFSTSFDLVTQEGERFARHASGNVGNRGGFDNGIIIGGGSNTVLQGVAALNSAGAMEAAYVFQSRLDEQRVSSGVTYWGTTTFQEERVNLGTTFLTVRP